MHDECQQRILYGQRHQTKKIVSWLSTIQRVITTYETCLSGIPQMEGTVGVISLLERDPLASPCSSSWS